MRNFVNLRVLDVCPDGIKLSPCQERKAASPWWHSDDRSGLGTYSSGQQALMLHSVFYAV